MTERATGSLVLGLLMVVTFMATAAVAGEVVRSGYTWENGQKCVATDSGIAEGGHGGGQTRGYVLATKESRPASGVLPIVACINDYVRPVGYLAVKPDLWINSSGTWRYCIGQDYNYNNVDNARLQRIIGHNAPCGSGTYAANTYGGTYFDTAWRGGQLMSPAHYLLRQ